MCNYLSFGIDARIGYGFDIHRSNSAFKNKCVYCCEGLKRMCCYNFKINNVIESLDIIDEVIFIIRQDYLKQNYDIDIQNLSSQEIVKFSKDLGPTDQKPDGMINPNLPCPPVTVKSNSSALVCININSYMGGASDIWKSSSNNIGVVKDQQQQQQPKIEFNKQNFGDGQLEFLAFPSALSLGKERFLHGQAMRIAQGNGPFKLKFQNTKSEAQRMQVYFQVDGEYYQVNNPKYCLIGLTKEIERGKIKVLVKNN